MLRRTRLEQNAELLNGLLGGGRVALTNDGTIWILLCDLVEEVTELRSELEVLRRAARDGVLPPPT